MAMHTRIDKLEADKPTVTTRNGRTIIRIPMQLKRKNGRKRIIMPEGVDGKAAGETPVQQPLAIALAKGHCWRDLLESGKFESVAALSEALDLDPSFIRRHIRLTFMSPILVEKILDGNEPDGVSLEKLTDASFLWVSTDK